MQRGAKVTVKHITKKQKKIKRYYRFKVHSLCRDGNRYDGKLIVETVILGRKTDKSNLFISDDVTAFLQSECNPLILLN